MTKKAFLHAHDVLEYLNRQGILASATLFHDGSGSLSIPDREWEKVNPNIKAKLEEMLHSVRWDEWDGKYILSSCQGWHP